MTQAKTASKKKTASKPNSRKKAPRSSAKSAPKEVDPTGVDPQVDKPAPYPEVITLNDGRVVINGVVYDKESRETPPVEPVVTNPEPSKTPQKYIRNLTYTPLRIRFQSQEDQRNATNLERRGQRKDLTALRREWEDDPILIANLQAGTIEIITRAEAEEITAKQWTNTTQEIRPIEALIENQQGDSIAEQNTNPVVQIDDPAVNDVVVAPLTGAGGDNPGQIVFDDRGNIARPDAQQASRQVSDPYSGAQQTRLSGQAPISVAAPGSQNAPTAQAPLDEGASPESIEEEIARLRDVQARNGALSGPGAGVAGLRVEVEPVRRG